MTLQYSKVNDHVEGGREVIDCGNCCSCEMRQRFFAQYKAYIKDHPQSIPFAQELIDTDAKYLKCQKPRIGAY